MHVFNLNLVAFVKQPSSVRPRWVWPAVLRVPFEVLASMSEETSQDSEQGSGNETGLSRIANIFFSIVTFSYSATFNYYTLGPMGEIGKTHDYGDKKDGVIQALTHFRQMKTEELSFVQKAVSKISSSSSSDMLEA